MQWVQAIIRDVFNLMQFWPTFCGSVGAFKLVQKREYSAGTLVIFTKPT
jgi:hypothetical protein